MIERTPARELGQTRTERNRLKRNLEKRQDERRQLAERIAASSRLMAIGELCAGVSHELNNPLSVILGFAQSIARQYAHHPSLAGPIQSIEREATRCKQLVQSLLMFSRPPQPGKESEDLVSVLEGALCLVETQARVKQVEVIRDYAKNLPCVSLNRHQIQQMLINLCTNALDAMPDGGRLTIAAALHHGPKGASWVVIRVSDTGAGIPFEIRDRIYEPFFTTKEPGKGTGLGLSLVRNIVKEHQGHIEMVSIPLKGTTFFVRLPILTATNPEPVPSRAH